MIWYILGTRPELVKAWPVVQHLVLEKREHLVISTGQHTTLAKGMPVWPEVNLGVPGQDDPYEYVVQAVARLVDFANDPNYAKPDWIVVQGDTASAIAGATYAKKAGIPLLHVEAGLRSGDYLDPWPEEGFRRAIDHLATKKACPTALNLANLEAEGLAEGAEVTGNPITDALRLSGAHKTPGTHVLITLHRRESFGADMKLCAERIFDLARAHPDTPFLWPTHPNPHVLEALKGQHVPDNLDLTTPMAYREFLTALCASKVVITDSGGVVEEATTLGIPTLVCRNKTERPEACATHSILVGRDGHGLLPHTRGGIPFPDAITTAMNLHPEPMPIFGDGHCAPRITRMLT